MATFGAKVSGGIRSMIGARTRERINRNGTLTSVTRLENSTRVVSAATFVITCLSTVRSRPTRIPSTASALSASAQIDGNADAGISSSLSTWKTHSDSVTASR